MPSFVGGNLGLTWGFIAHEDGWGTSYDTNFRNLDAITHLAILEILSTPPGSPAADDRYIVGPTATGAWTGQEDKIAVWTKLEDPDTRDWIFLTPKDGWRAWNVDTQTWYQYDGSDWNEDVAVTPVESLFDFSSLNENDVIVYDTTATKFINVRPMRAFGFGADPTSILSADQEIFYLKLPFDFTIPADFGDYRGSGTTFGGTAVAAADVVFRLQKADAATPLTFADVGEITIGIGSVVVSVLDSSAVDIECLRDDVLRILAPTVPDTTFKGPFGSLVGYEPAP